MIDKQLLSRAHRELLDVLNSINQDKIHHDGDDFHELLNDIEKTLAQPEPIQGLQCFHCQVTIETLNDKVMHLLAQRKPLTEEQIKEIWLNGKDHGDDWLDVQGIARAIEAAHGIKENT